MSGFDLETTYLSLDGAGAVVRHPVDERFWATIDANPTLQGTLVAAFKGDRDWTHWEMHPAGEEILVLLEGELVMLFEGAEGETRHPMFAGTTVIVPAGIWHRALVDRPTRLLAITYGAGTEHKPI
jgi:mannose-6-phosphate isomerase-like protein (cupin superfamily)